MIFKFFLFSILLLLFSYFVFRIVVRVEYQTKQKLSPLSYLLETLVFALHANFPYVYLSVRWPGIPAAPENILLKALFWVIVSIGLIILLIAWFRLGTSTSFGLDKNKLRTNGIYQYSRNPQLLGYGMIIIGFAILYLSWYSSGWILLYVTIAWFMILSEEEFLKRKYKKEYENYFASVPRILKFF